jgi:hypothetical protein
VAVNSDLPFPARDDVAGFGARRQSCGGFAMPLQRGEVLGYDFNRMVVDFTMFNQGKTVRCAISTAAMPLPDAARADFSNCNPCRNRRGPGARRPGKTP